VPAIRARRVQRMKIEGLEFIPEARRTYPRDFLASQLIGTSAPRAAASPASSTRSTASSTAATASAA
jgi:hypothetical protein